MKQIVILFLLISINFICVHACECNPNLLRNEIDDASEIFQAEVLKNEKIPSGYIYHFKVRKVWKGNYEIIKRVKTGFGGGDCGMQFETGKIYTIFSKDKETSRCNRNSETNTTSDDLKLEYIFSKGRNNSLFQNHFRRLNKNESDYLNERFKNNRWKFNFEGKSIAFTRNLTPINKSNWFDFDCSYSKMAIQLFQLTEQEQEKLDYDAILVFMNDQTITKQTRKKLIKTLTKKAINMKRAGFIVYNRDLALEDFELAINLEKSDSLKRAVMYYQNIAEFDELSDIGKISKNKLDSIWLIEKNKFQNQLTGKWRWIWSGTNWGTEDSPKKCNCQKYLRFEENEIILYEDKHEKERYSYKFIKNIPKMSMGYFLIDVNNGEKLWRFRIYQEIENAYFLSERSENANFFMSLRDEKIIPNCFCGCSEKRYEKL